MEPGKTSTFKGRNNLQAVDFLDPLPLPLERPEPPEDEEKGSRTLGPLPLLARLSRRRQGRRPLPSRASDTRGTRLHRASSQRPSRPNTSRSLPRKPWRVKDVLNKCVGSTARILDNAESRKESCHDSTRLPRAVTTWLARNSKAPDSASSDQSKSEQPRPVDTPGTLHKWIATSPTRR